MLDVVFIMLIFFIVTATFVKEVGRAGTFVLRSDGTFEGGILKATWTVISGTGELAGLHGTVQFEKSHAESYEVNLEYTFE